MKTAGASFNRGSSKQDYETPDDLIQAVVKRFGLIACDLAASEKNAKAADWLDEEENSLHIDWHSWHGNLWLNPPFSNIAPWAQKCAEESRKGAKILFLVPASVGSNWFAHFVFGQAKVLFLQNRITFKGAKDPYPKDCILACYGFDDPGFEMWRWK